MGTGAALGHDSGQRMLGCSVSALSESSEAARMLRTYLSVNLRKLGADVGQDLASVGRDVFRRDAADGT